MIRLYVPDDLAAGADVAPSPEQGRYLVTVMRLAIGAEVLLFNGRDGEWRATLVGRTHGKWNPADVVPNISGTTLSTVHVAEGVKKILAIHARYLPAAK